MSVLWEWNETDLTQFDAVGDGGYTTSVTTWATRFGGNNERPAIRYDSPATTSFHALLIKTTEFDFSAYENKRLVIEAHASATAAGNPCFVLYYEDVDHLHVARLASTAGTHRLSYRNGSSTWVDPTFDLESGLSFGNDGETVSIGFRCHQFAGALQNPWVRCIRSFTWMENPAVHQFLAKSSYAASWNSLSFVPRLGIGKRSFGVAASPGDLFAAIRILEG